MNSTSNTPSAASKLQEQTHSSNVTEIEEGRVQTLNNISDLQNIEKGYFSKLNDGLLQNSLTPEEKDMLVQKINEISQMRINLYKNLNGMYSFYHTNVASTRNTVEEQSVAIDIVEKELNEAKLRMKAIEEEKYNKLRLVEINTYYGEQYSEHTSIMKLIIMICVPVLLLTILLNQGLFPGERFSTFANLIVFRDGEVVAFKRCLQLSGDARKDGQVGHQVVCNCELQNFSQNDDVVFYRCGFDTCVV
jgi:hypothetical protein